MATPLLRRFLAVLGRDPLRGCARIGSDASGWRLWRVAPSPGASSLLRCARSRPASRMRPHRFGRLRLAPVARCPEPWCFVASSLCSVATRFAGTLRVPWPFGCAETPLACWSGAAAAPARCPSAVLLCRFLTVFGRDPLRGCARIGSDGSGWRLRHVARAQLPRGRGVVSVDGLGEPGLDGTAHGLGNRSVLTHDVLGGTEPAQHGGHPRRSEDGQTHAVDTQLRP